MGNLSPPARDSVAAQAEMFRRAKQEFGLSIPVLAKLTPIPKTTMEGWEKETAMPAWAIGALGEAGVPDHLLSLITAPWQRCVVTEEDGEDGDLDTAALAANDFAATVLGARSPKSPGGVAIVPQEAAIIHPKRQRAVALMRRAA